MLQKILIHSHCSWTSGPTSLALHAPQARIVREDGEWIWCGYGDSPDQGGVTVPQEVLDRVAEGRPGKLEVEGEGYWIKPSGPRRS